MISSLHRRLVDVPGACLVGALVFTCETVTASSIDRPAGGVPSHESKSVSGLSASPEMAKSKLIPLRRKMTVAVSDGSEGADRRQNKNANVPAEKNELTSGTSSSSGTVKVKNEPAGEPASAGLAITDDVDPWDSAAKRFDQQDPARNVTKGVRVEDIIEPSADYQYSGSRKKNPFIPALVMGRGAAAKDVNPNDVEIPIINPLQSFAANQLSVIGVWEGDDRVWKALIQTPTNQGIETKLGDPAGNSGGRVMSISPDAVVVREFTVRADGTREYRDIPLYMGSDKPLAADEDVGGRLILRPGAAAPEIEAPDASLKRFSNNETVIPSGISGQLSTLAPANVTSPGAVTDSNAAQTQNGGGTMVAPAPLVPASMAPTPVEGGFK